MHALDRVRRRPHPSIVEYLCSLPSAFQLENQILLVHGGVRNVQQYMTEPHHIEENVRYSSDDNQYAFRPDVTARKVRAIIDRSSNTLQLFMYQMSCSIRFFINSILAVSPRNPFT
jgi:hypothetical protein